MQAAICWFIIDPQCWWYNARSKWLMYICWMNDGTSQLKPSDGFPLHLERFCLECFPIKFLILVHEALNNLGPAYLSNSVLFHTSSLLLYTIFHNSALGPVHLLSSVPGPLSLNSGVLLLIQISDHMLHSQRGHPWPLTPNTLSLFIALTLHKHYLFMCFFLLSPLTSR